MGLSHLQLGRKLAVLMAVALTMAPLGAEAAGLTARSIGLSTSKAGAAATAEVVGLTTATGSSIGSIGFAYCTTASGSCTVPTGLVTTSAALTAQSGATGFSIVNTVNGAPYITRTAGIIAASTALSYTLSNITNPTTTNQTFFVRITTYISTDGATGPVDTGTVAVSTAEQVQLTGVTPEILVFCVGTTIVSDCTTMSGNTVDFGDFDPQATKSGTSIMQASTNAANGYAISVNGTTLASGVNTIPALGSQAAPVVGTSQFGMNLRANTAPVVGANPLGAGSGTFTGNYGTQNQYRFVSGDNVAQAGLPTNANTFTASYMVNIGGSQAAGVYTTTMTYICTASF